MDTSIDIANSHFVYDFAISITDTTLDEQSNINMQA